MRPTLLLVGLLAVAASACAYPGAYEVRETVEQHSIRKEAVSPFGPEATVVIAARHEPMLMGEVLPDLGVHRVDFHAGAAPRLARVMSGKPLPSAHSSGGMPG